VGAVLNTVKVSPGSSIAVFGAGGVGLSVIMGARLAKADRIIAIDRSAAKIAMAKEFGATHALLVGENTITEIRRLTEGRGADYVFEAIGLTAVQEQCLEAVRPGGTVALVGISPVGSSTNLPGAIISRQEKTVTGSYYGSCNPTHDFPLFVNLYLQGKLNLDRLISKTYALDQINEAYAEMLSGQLARGVITF
jgi:Zn-dependent alcohol dehydrogenase